jgi:hypothetical protein
MAKVSRSRSKESTKRREPRTEADTYFSYEGRAYDDGAGDHDDENGWPVTPVREVEIQIARITIVFSASEIRRAVIPCRGAGIGTAAL